MENEKNYLKSFFGILKKNNLDYSILRGGEFFTSKKKVGELDIMVPKNKLKKLKEIFKKIPKCRVLKNNIDLTHPFLVRINCGEIFLDLDFQIRGVGHCGSAILKEEYLLKNKLKKGNLNYLNAEAEFLMLFVHGFIFKKKLEYFKKYEERFKELHRKIDKKKLRTFLTKKFGKKLSEKILFNLKNNNFENLFNLQKKLRRKHILKNPLRIFPIFYSKGMRFRNYFELNDFFQFINPFKWGPLISFIGVDGSGKSTLAKESKLYLDKFRIKNKIVSASVFSPIKKPFYLKNSNEDYSEKVSRKNNFFELGGRFILQLPKQLKIIYYRKKGYFVITDRYSYDLINFYGAKGFLKFLIKHFSNKPKKCFYISSDPQEIKKRNTDLDIIVMNKIMKRIEENKSYLNLEKINNRSLSKAKNQIKNSLGEIIKNV